MTKYYLGDAPCGRSDEPILLNEDRFSGTDEDGEEIILCEICHDDGDDNWQPVAEPIDPLMDGLKVDY